MAARPVELDVLEPASASASAGYPSRSSSPTPASSSHVELTGSQPPPANKELFDSYPDGGVLPWMTVLACFSLFFTTVGGVYSWGVFQDALVAAGVAPASTLAFIGSTQATMQAILAIPISRAIAAYGPRRVALAGTACAGLGPILAGFCTNSVVGLLFTEGILFGLGEAMCFFCAATLPTMYFLRRRNLANGIVYSGAGVGGAVLSITTSALLQRVGLPWTFRCVGLIMTAINLPASLVLRTRLEKQPFRSGKKVFDWQMFRSVRFVLLLIGTALAIFPTFVPPFFLPLYAGSVGLGKTESSMIVAGFNLASAVGRIAFGLGADGLFGSLNSLFLCLLINALSAFLLWPFATTLGPLITFVIVNGACAGGMFSLVPGTLSSTFGSSRLPVLFSTILTFWMAGYFLGAPIAGFLLQAYGGPGKGADAYFPAIMYAGALSLAAAGFVLAVRIIQSRELWKKL